ncbi:hypothetical protein [Leptotrichia massiliensis]|uniref:hypothetical protein n=1 Tax=Leptotrichia massiliensis TaxID=1852388 RepID=UPI0028EFB0C7|nr:hypothetical protein [Leptotrichia massiliensis]
MFQKYHNERIKELPIRTIKYISNSEITEAEVIEIIESEEPSKKIKELEGKQKNELTKEEKVIELKHKIILAKNNIRKWEEEIKELEE